MRPDGEPIPHEELPPGWRPATHDADRIVYRLHEPAIELLTVRTEADRSHPALGLGRCWELRFRHLVGEQPVVESIGRVSTRRAALAGLCEGMQRIHDYVEDPSDPFAVRNVLEAIRFEDCIPEYKGEHT